MAFGVWLWLHLASFGLTLLWLLASLGFCFFLLQLVFSASVLTSLFFMSEKRHFRTLVEYGLQLGEYLKHSM